MDGHICEAVVKAGKNHRCIWCGDQIDTGCTYLRQVCRYDGVFQTSKFHMECAKAAEEYGEEFDPYSNKRGE